MGDSEVYGLGGLQSDPTIIDVTSTEAFLVRKEGDGGDVFTVDTTNSKVLIPDGASGVPGIAFQSHPTSGLYAASANFFRFVFSGTDTWDMTSTRFGKNVAAYPIFLNEAATAINPNILPDASDSTTGLGQTAANFLTFVAGGVEGPSVATNGGIAAFYMPEITTPTAVTNYGAVYPKSNNILYFQDGAGTEHPLGGVVGKVSSYHHATGGAGTHYVMGYYDAPVADANLNQGSLTVTQGTANIAYAAHIFVVAGAAGTTDGSDLVLTVTGASITEAGVRNGSDSEVVVATATGASTNEYFETTKKWLGQVTLTLSSSGGGTFSFDFNYGFAKYEDLIDTDFTVTAIDVVIDAGANDSGFNMQLLHHGATGWTYHASAFDPGGTVLADMDTDYGSTEVDLASGKFSAWKHNSMSQAINADSGEGVILKFTTGSANSIEAMDVKLHYTQ